MTKHHKQKTTPPLKYTDVTTALGLILIMLGPNNKVIKWTVKTLWKGQLIWKCSAPLDLWLDLLKSTTTWRAARGRLENQHRWQSTMKTTDGTDECLSVHLHGPRFNSPSNTLDLWFLFKCLRWMVPERWTTVLEFSRLASYERCHWTPPPPGIKWHLLLHELSAKVISYLYERGVVETTWLKHLPHYMLEVMAGTGRLAHS